MAKEVEIAKGQEAQKTKPASELGVFDGMERLFDKFFTRGWLRHGYREWPELGEFKQALESRYPHVDVIDRDGEVIVKAELPGVDKKDPDVSMAEDSVTIEGCTGMRRRKKKAITTVARSLAAASPALSPCPPKSIAERTRLA